MGLAEIRARNEKWRAEGKLPGAKGTGTSAAPKPARVPLALCVYLGDRVSAACGELARRCNLYGCTTAAVARCPKAERSCQTCEDYVPLGGSAAG